MEKNVSKATPAKAVATKSAAQVKQEKKVETKVETKPVAPIKAEKVEIKPVVETKKVAATQEKETEKKAAANKPAAAAKKTTAKKAPVKEIEQVEEVYVQFGSQEFLTKEVLERAKQAYIAEGHKESSIKSIRLYIKPEENMAYYVINEKIAGGVPV